jgi:hypothetical protein
MTIPPSPSGAPSQREQALVLLVLGVLGSLVFALFNYKPGGSAPAPSRGKPAPAGTILKPAPSVAEPREVRQQLQRAYDYHAAAMMMVRQQGYPEAIADQLMNPTTIPSATPTTLPALPIRDRELADKLFGIYAPKLRVAVKEGVTQTAQDLEWLLIQYNFDTPKRSDFYSDESYQQQLSYVQAWRPYLDRVTETIQSFVLTGDTVAVRRLEKSVNVIEGSPTENYRQREIFDIWHLEGGEWQIVYTERGEVFKGTQQMPEGQAAEDEFGAM